MFNKFWFDAKNINCFKNGFRVIKDLNLKISYSENVILIGPNGSGKTSLIELKVLCRNAFLTVSTDSAAMHISAAEGTPTIGIFGSTTQKSIPASPWAIALWDNSYYPNGNLPKCTSDIGNYYDNIKLEDGLKKLEPFLQI